jgi:hypothetical protein
MIKKLVLTTLSVAALLFALTSNAQAYTQTQTDVLSSGFGDVLLTVGIWSPADTDPGNPFYGTGYWGYEYEMHNIDLTYVSWLNIGGEGVEHWKTPAGWTFFQPIPNDNFRWDADSGNELYPGQTIGGFGVKSGTYYAGSTWSYVEEGTDIEYAYGETIGPVNEIPEPCSLLLFGGGLVALFGTKRRKP